MNSLDESQINQSKARIARDQRGGIIASLINLVFGFIISVIALRIVFELFGANPANGLVSVVYGLSAPFVAPFSGIFGTVENSLAVARLDFPAIVALLVYGLIAGLVNGVIGYSHRHVVS